MKIRFNLEYSTVYGENLVLNILDNNGEKVASHAMKPASDKAWKCDMDVPAKAGHIDYYYSVERDGKEQRHEWIVIPHRLDLNAAKANRYITFDHWNDMPDDSYLYSSAFTDCVALRKQQLPAKCKYPTIIQLKVRAPQLRTGEVLGVVGNEPTLGDWNEDKALKMIEHNHNEWVICIDGAAFKKAFVEFKFVIMGEKGKPTIWETGDNRTVLLPVLKEGEHIVYELQQAYFPLYPVKLAGTVVPIFSLRSEGSFGVGDFGDLKLMVDWVAHTGQRALQVLPINDTTITHTWSDSYPYNSISIYALHPQYLDLRQLPKLDDKKRMAEFEKLRRELNALAQIDYERVNNAKREYMKLLFKQEGDKVLKSDEFKAFFTSNEDWLVPYAAFCHFRDEYGTASFSRWPSHHILTDEDRAAMCNPRTKVYKEVSLWYYIQYYLDKQMRSAHKYAQSKHVVLKGDIPIGISRDSVEAWVEPKYFNLNGQAGAPPDAFSTNGQNWGFPTYNWDVMLADGCKWWVKRFRKMAQYFDAYRIDHVLGFFRIWEIPVPETSGLMGQFAPALGLSREEIEGYGIYGHDDLFLVDHKRPDRWHPRIAVQFNEAYHRLNDWEKQQFNRLYNDYFYRRNNQFWYEEAMKKLPFLTQATRMLACAEDLGMVPDCVGWVMNELRILTLEIQSMPKDNTVRFGQLWRNPYRSVCTISTHDMPMLRQWWDENWERAQSYYNSVLWHDGPAPHPMPGWLARDIVCQHLASPSMLCLLSLQDWLATDETLRHPDPISERINIPANSRHYWRWRMPLTLEQLMQADDFNDSIRDMITRSGRT